VEGPSTRPLLVLGAGYVGLVTALGLAELGNDVHLVESSPDRLAALRAGRAPIHEAGVSAGLVNELDAGRLTVSDRPRAPFRAAIVCVGTPIDADGQSDLRQIKQVLGDLAPLMTGGSPLVIRSTLPPGSTLRVVESAGLPTSRVFTNPEFLRQGSALADFRRPTRIVIGRFSDADDAALAIVAGIFDGVNGPRLVVDVAAAELIKNAANAFLALKLSFTNEVASLCEEYGADVDDVLTGMALDPRIGSQYMRPGFGFGGSCLPKELQALAAAGTAKGLAMDVTIAASSANSAQQARFADRIRYTLGGVDGRTIALLGLAFKAGTDDVRGSPAVRLAARLIQDGATVRGYDIEAAKNAVRELPSLLIAATVTDALRGADAVVIGTESPEYRELDWGELRSVMAAPLIFDGRRLLDPYRLRSLGYRYEAIGEQSTVTRSRDDVWPVAAHHG
jgi:UDPglucose 6-dehydrogenase